MEHRTSVWERAVTDQEVIGRYLDKLVDVPGSTCLWWTGAVSGRGHGRFWLGEGRVAIARRFAFALRHGLAALAGARILGHRCDNPLCQRIDEEHVVRSSPRENRLEWVSRRDLYDSPLADPRGPRGRAELLRSLARTDPVAVRDEIERVRKAAPQQMRLW